MSARPIRSDAVIWEELDGRALLVHAETGARWTLNAAALALWKLCDGTRTRRALASLRAAATGRTVAESRAELAQFIASLSGMGLLQCVGTDGRVTAAPAYFSAGSDLGASFQGRSLGGARRRPSPRGNSGPG